MPRAAFAELAPQHREVLRLRFLEELGYDKVAEQLDVTEHAARQRVYRALQALRAAVTATTDRSELSRARAVAGESYGSVRAHLHSADVEVR